MRDRATLYLAELQDKLGGAEVIAQTWSIPAKNLEKSLQQYLANGAEGAFDLVRCLSAWRYDP